MFKRQRPRPTRRDEAVVFGEALVELRRAMGWTQGELGARLRVSRRTLTNWEGGYWLPPLKQRPHVVLALTEAPPDHVLGIAETLGVSSNPGAGPVLDQLERALDAIMTPPAAQAKDQAPPATPEELRAIVDAIVREAADAMDASPNAVREVIGRVLAACRERGATLEAIAAGVAVTSGKRKKG